MTSITIAGTVLTPDNDILSYQPPIVSNLSAVGQSYGVALEANTLATINLPAGTVWVGLRMPANNTTGLTLNTGTSVHKTLGVPCLPLDPGQTSITLEATAAITVQLTTG